MTIRKTRLRDIGSDEFESDVREGVGSWTIGRVGCLAVVAVIAFVVIGTIGRFALGWFDTAVNVASPENVTKQYRDAYTRYEALKAMACNVKTARAVVVQEVNPDLKSQRQSQEIAYEQNYNRIAAEYQAAFDNAFEAKHVGPDDLPGIAPNLETAVANCG